MHRSLAHVSTGLSLLFSRPTRERSGWFAWTAVLFGAGVAFGLFHKTGVAVWPAAVGVAVAALLLRHAAARGAVLVAAALAVAGLTGFGAVAFKSHWNAASVLHVPLPSVTVEGVILGHDSAPPGFGYTLAPTHIEGLAPDALPGKLRIFHRGSTEPVALGSSVRLQASLFPYSKAVHTEAHEATQKASLEGIGATGLARSLAVLDRPLRSLSLWEEAGIAVATLRRNIFARIRSHLSGTAAGIAAALTLGERDLIPGHASAALRGSGLAHLIAISGLHMALVAGAFFGIASLLLARASFLRRRWPLHKWAAVVSLPAAGFYLLISGMSAASERAFVMVLVAMLALLWDRAMISAGNLALAALAVLTLWPESLPHVGFQMSFAATLVLVAVYAGGFPDPPARRAPFWTQTRQNMRVLAAALLLTTVVAGCVTAFLAGHHFRHIALYATLANMLALPIFALLVMPMMLLSLPAMLFDLEAVPLHLLGLGGEAIIGIAAWVAGLPGSRLHLAGQPSPWLLPLFALFLCGLCLGSRLWRLAGLAGLAAVFLLLGRSP